MRGPAARLVGIALAAAGIAAAASAFAAPASSGYDEGLAAYRKNDYAKSLKVLRPLAERGDARAQYLIGRQYQFGQAVKADRAEAYYWYKRAEAKGHLEAKLFRLLLEKRWKITAAEKGRAERRIAAENAPKPRVARVESRPTPRPERVEASKPAEKPGPAASAAERDATAKRKIETARARPPELPKAEMAKAKPERAPDRTAAVAARTAVPDETPSTEPPPRRDTSEFARAMPRPTLRDDDDDDDGASPRRREPPRPESRMAVAAVPSVPPPGDDHASDYPQYHSPPDYAPPAPSYAPPGPYLAPGMVPYYAYRPPYYAPAAPPGWRATIHFGPRPHYRQPWGYRHPAAYTHPGWRGRGWRGRW